MSNLGRATRRLVTGILVLAVAGSIDVSGPVSTSVVDTSLLAAVQRLDPVPPENVELAGHLDLLDRDAASAVKGSVPFTLGDDAGLDQLWTECDAGSGVSCDRLFEASPVGSDYERFAVSCGDRRGTLDCRVELDGEPAESDPLETFGIEGLQPR